MRIVMKISGEALKNENSAISKEMLDKILEDIKLLKDNELILVLGGGNLFRGRKNIGINDVRMDQIGMMGTVINALAVGDYLNLNGIKTKVYSAFNVDGIVERYSYSKVIDDLNNKNVIVLGGGCGLVNFSTDFVTVERAVELKADLVMMAKSIDGVYDKNPNKFSDCKKFDYLSFEEFLNLGYNDLERGIIDFEANVLLSKHKIPLYVYGAKNGSISNFINKKYDGTFIK